MSLCVCGCGRELTGRQTRHASRQCRDRDQWHKHKEARKPLRERKYRERRAAQVVATTPELSGFMSCENRRAKGGCWTHPEGCFKARATGACTKHPATPSVDALTTPGAGRVKCLPMLREASCKVCGVTFLARSASACFCGNACRCRAYYQGRRVRDGRQRKELHLPAPRAGDGVRRCLWCQIPIDGHPSKRTCSRLCIERVCAHNSGKSYSASVMTVRL